jgi:hypothetical protein
MPETLKIGEAMQQALSEASQKREDPDALPQQLGRSLMEAAFESIVNRVKGQVEPTDPLDQLDRELQRIDRFRRFFGGQGGGGGGEPEMNTAWATVLKAMMDSQATMQRYILEAQTKSQEQLMQWQKEQNERFERFLREFKEQLQGSQEENWLKKIGFDQVMSKLNSNPVQEWHQLRQMFWEEFERTQQRQDQTKIVNLEQWKAEKQFALEEKRIEKETERDKARAEAQSQLAQAFAAAVAPRLQGAALAAAPEAAPGFAYECWQCHQAFTLPQPVRQGQCPHCQAPFTVQVGQAPATAPGPEAPAPTPAPASGLAAVGGLDWLEEEF